jgi:hypothetical protein
MGSHYFYIEVKNVCVLRWLGNKVEVLDEWEYVKVNFGVVIFSKSYMGVLERYEGRVYVVRTFVFTILRSLHW